MNNILKTLCISLLFVAANSMAVEEAQYDVLVSDENLEVRDYAPQIVAEVIVNEDFEDAGNQAFRKLFKYISGANIAGDKISMTAPVKQEKEGAKIAMTAPVSQTSAEEGWAVSFMMPAEYSMQTIPTPEDPEIVLREIPAQKVAAIRFKGRWTRKNYDRHLEELMIWVENKQLEISGEPVWARYNAPFTPWFMRRNEILIPLAGSQEELRFSLN